MNKPFPNYQLSKVINAVYKLCSLQISHITIEEESKEYDACHFKLNDLNILCRNAKITPKKAGQFVTCWKRNENNIIEPFFESDPIDFYVVNVQTEKHSGQFVFPKSLLIKKGIISTVNKEGKRAFRVYPPWDITTNKQAAQTQKWQVEYFLTVNHSTDIERAKELYSSQKK